MIRSIHIHRYGIQNTKKILLKSQVNVPTIARALSITTYDTTTTEYANTSETCINHSHRFDHHYDDKSSSYYGRTWIREDLMQNLVKSFISSDSLVWHNLNFSKDVGTKNQGDKSKEERDLKKGSSKDNNPSNNDENDENIKIDDKTIHHSKSDNDSSENGNQNNSNKNKKNKNKQNNSQNLTALAVLGVLFAISATLMTSGETDNVAYYESTREVTWNDFRNFMLETGDVEKIVVINKKTTAVVVLRRGAKGIPANAERLQRRTRFLSSSSMMNRDDGGIGSSNNDDNHNYDVMWERDSATTMDMGMRDDLNTTNTNERGSFSSSLSSSNRNNKDQLIYRFAIGSVDAFEKKLDDAQREIGFHPKDFVKVQYAKESSLIGDILGVVPSIVVVAFLMAIMRGAGGGIGGGSGGGMGSLFKVGKSTHTRIMKKDMLHTFSDVAGCQEAKKEIMEFVDFLQDSDRFTKLGAKIPKGALLCGPPGTGKTLLAKAVAGEANVPFFSISGSDFIEMFVGVGPSRVRDMFKDARENAPCIIFIDEIDAVGRKRGRGGFMGGNDERENTLNQLLVEMDGFNPSEGVVVLAGTNRVDILDEALVRAGRFDRQIQVDLPDIQGRKEIFMVHLKGITVDGSLDEVAGRLAALTPGFAGADIANICNEGAIQAARRGGDSVTAQDFEKATDRIIGGLESNKLMTEEDKNIVAHHEAGHAVAGWFLEHADPLLKVTIIPRSSGALGYAQYLPKEIFLRTHEQIMDTVCMALAGRAAEEIFFGKVTTGAADDLRRVTGMVYQTIKEYGMNSKIGQLAFPTDPNAMFADRPYSNATAETIDEEARLIVDAAYQRTLNLLREKKTELEKVAQLLREKETITHDDVVRIIGPRPFAADDAYKELLHGKEVSEHKDEEKDTHEGDDIRKDDETNVMPGLTQ